MSSAIGELKIGLVFEDKSFNNSLKNVEASSAQAAETTSLKWQAMAGVVQHIAVGAFNAATGAVSNFARSIVSTGMQFDTAMSQVAATMGVTVDDINELSTVAQKMGATTKFTATEAAEGLNILAMAGLDAQSQIAGIPVVLDLASAGAMSLENSASYIIGAVNGFSDSMDNAQYYADLMAKGATLANTSVEGLGAALGRSAATAATYGQKADSVTLSLLRLANQNVTGEEAATALNRAMADLYTPTKDAAAALAELGISVYDANGSARDFNEVADELKVALSGMSEEEANAYANTIFTTQGLNAFNKMTVASTEKVDAFKAGLDDAFGSAASQAKTQIDNLEGSMAILSSSFDGAKLAIYGSLKPALLDGANGLLDFAEALNGVITGTGDIEMALYGFVEQMGSAISNTLSQIGTIIGKVAPVLVKAVVGLIPDLLRGLIAMASNIIEGLAAELPNMLTSIVEAILGIIHVLTDPGNIEMFLNAGLALLMGLVDAIPQIVVLLVERLPDIIGGIIEGLLSAIPQLIQAAVTLLYALVEAIPKIIPPLVAALPKIITTIVSYLLDPKVIAMLFDAALELFMALVMALPDMLVQLIPALPEILMTIVGFLLNPSTLAQLFNAAVQLFLQLVMAVPKILGRLVEAFGELFGQLWEHIEEFFGGIAEWIAPAASEIGAFFEGIATAIGEFFGAVGAVVGEIVGNIVGFFVAAGETIFGIFSAIGEFFATVFAVPIAIVEKLIEIIFKLGEIIGVIVYTVVAVAVQFFIDLFQTVWDFMMVGITALGEWFTALWEGLMEALTAIGEFFSMIFEAIWLAVSTVIENIKGAFQAAWNFITGIFGKVGQWFKDRFTEVYNNIKTVFNTVVDFFKGIWDSVVNIFTSIGEAVGNGVKGALAAAINFVLQAIETVVNAGIDFINGLIEAVNNLADLVGLHINPIAHISLGRVQFAKGGIVPGADYYGDHVPALMNSGEMVLTRGQQAALWNAIESGDFEAPRPVMPEPAIADVDMWANALAHAFSDDEISEDVEERVQNVTMYNEINSELDAEEIGNIMLESIRRAA